MLRVAVVEDDAATREQLCGFVARYAKEAGLRLETTAFADGGGILENGKPGFDIIFLDIEMPGLSGMETAERIRAGDPDVVLVFVTNLAQYAIRGYEVEALDFVLKPVGYYPFSVKLQRAVERARRRKGGQVALQLPGGVKLLETAEIYYLETRDRMLHYHTAGGVYTLRGSLQNAEKELSAHSFVRCNQCYLVNLRHVTGIQGDYAQVAGEQLEISRRQKANFLAAVAAYVGGMT